MPGSGFRCYYRHPFPPRSNPFFFFFLGLRFTGGTEFTDVFRDGTVPYCCSAMILLTIQVLRPPYSRSLKSPPEDARYGFASLQCAL